LVSQTRARRSSNQALLEPFIEIKGKLMSLRRRLEARRQMTVAGTQRPADRPVIYFDADPDEEALWQDLKGSLRDLAIVRPVKLAQANGDLDPLDREQQKQRQLQFASSDGLVLLHGRRGTWIENAVELSYRQRQLLWQSRHNNLPWAILDRVGDPLSVADTYDVPCVPATSNEWPRQLLVALGLSIRDQGVAP
jgi:hypothetical protein